MSAPNETLIEFIRGWGFTGLADAMAAADASAALTPLGMFMDADWVVKSVMLGLIIASVLAWAVWAGKLVQIAAASSRLGRDYRRLAGHGRLGAELARRGAIARMQDAAEAEMAASDGLPNDGIKTRTAADLARIEAGAARAMQGGIMVIGSIGSTAPFIGLFGTVWGIMNAFVGISESGSTNLAVVAPGIAEALMATAIGLIAAIPAVLFYNHLTRVIGGYRARLADAVSLVERTLSRDLDRRAARPPAEAVTAEIVALAAE